MIQAQQDYNDDMSRDWEEYARLDAIERAKDQLLIGKIKILMGGKFSALLDLYLNELGDSCTDIGQFEIVRNRGGHKQKIDCFNHRRLSHEWVNQYENGGYSGDSYAGQIWIPLKGGRYFTFHYRM